MMVFVVYIRPDVDIVSVWMRFGERLQWEKRFGERLQWKKIEEATQILMMDEVVKE